LPENFRLPILLCDLEGKAIKEVAQQLGVTARPLAVIDPVGRSCRHREMAGSGAP
jgi:hypothetical protein